MKPNPVLTPDQGIHQTPWRLAAPCIQPATADPDHTRRTCARDARLLPCAERRAQVCRPRPWLRRSPQPSCPAAVMSLASEKFHRQEENGDNSMAGISTEDFCILLANHDWRFDQFKYIDRYEHGLRSQKKLLYLCQQQPGLFRLYNYAENCIIRSLPFDFPSVVGTTPVKDETPHTQTTTPMKDLLQSIFETLIKPLIDAIDRNTASKGGCSAPALEPAAPAPTVAEKPAKAPKAAKPASAPAPEPEPEEAAPAISEARLITTVKTLPKEGKIKLKEYFTKKFGYNTMAEIAEENRNDIHAAAIKIGATDTDPEASDDVEGM